MEISLAFPSYFRLLPLFLPHSLFMKQMKSHMSQLQPQKLLWRVYILKGKGSNKTNIQSNMLWFAIKSGL